jgi:hypothetical protein
MIDDEDAARRNLKTFMLLVNKSDLWGEDYSLANLLDDYKNETRRLKSQSERVGYQYFIRSSSLITGDGTEEAMRLFFNTIRPKVRPVAESPVYA